MNWLSHGPLTLCSAPWHLPCHAYCSWAWNVLSSYCPRPSDLSPAPSHSRMSSLRLSQWLPSSSSRSPAPLLREPLLTLVPSRGPVPGEGSARRISAGWMNGAHTLSCQLLPAPLQRSVRTTEPSRHVRPFRAGPCLPALLSSVSQGLRPCPLLPTLGAGSPHSQGVTCWGSLAPSQTTHSPLSSALAGWVQSARC